MEITPEIVLALIGVFGTILNYWYTKTRVAAETRTIEADAARKLSETAAGLADEIQTHIVDELKAQLQKYADRVERLELLTTHQEQLLTEQGHKLTEQGHKLAEQDITIKDQGHKLAEQDITIKEQGGIIMSLRQRVSDLEHENGNLRKENDQLKQRGGKL